MSAARRPRSPALPPHADILLVDESEPEAELTLKPLRSLEPQPAVAIARDGEEALDFLFARGTFASRSGAPLPRLVLLSLTLPKVDGFEVLSALRANARTSQVPVVVLTSSTDSREVAQCYQLGANSCVQKPVKYEELWSAVEEIGRYWLGRNQLPAADPASAGYPG